jgi:hypothetical protein
LRLSIISEAQTEGRPERSGLLIPCGQGARLMEVCFERGIEWKLAGAWLGDRELERRLKMTMVAAK